MSGKLPPHKEAFSVSIEMEIDLFFSSLNEFKILISRITHFWKIDAICAYLNIVVSSNRYRLQYKWHIFSVLLIRTTLCVYWYVLPVSWLTSSLICLQACFDNQSDRSHSRWKESISEWSRCGSFLSSLGYRVPGCSLLRTGGGLKVLQKDISIAKWDFGRFGRSHHPHPT